MVRITNISILRMENVHQSAGFGILRVIPRQYIRKRYIRRLFFPFLSSASLSQVKEALKAAKAKQEAEKSLDLERIARSKGKAKAKEKDVEAGGEGSHQKERNSKRHQVHLKLQKLLTIRRRSHQSVPAVAP